MKYVKKPIPIEAYQIFEKNLFVNAPDWFKIAVVNGDIFFNCTTQTGVTVKTLEGDMYASWGSFIVKGIDGELYPVRGDIFLKTYDVYEGQE